MAFSVWACSLPDREATDCWRMDLLPWNSRLREDPRFRQVPVDETGGYLDYCAVLTTREALALNRPYLEDRLPATREQAEQLRHLLLHETSSGLVVVSVYEWESGLIE